MNNKKISEKILIDDFGNEWNKFDQSKLNKLEHLKLYNNYFHLLPKNYFSKKIICADFGGGSGRWSQHIVKKVKKLIFVEPSFKAINVAKQKLKGNQNVIFVNKKIENVNFKNNSLDFAFSLGVLHHTNNYVKAINVIRKKIKQRGYFLIYLYYRFDNRPKWFFFLWKLSNLLRIKLSKLPFRIKSLLCDLIALIVYFPLAKFSKLIDYVGFNSSSIPLSFYKNCSLYTMRTDALDRFSTTIEHRFSKKEFHTLLKKNGFDSITFSKKAPYWCALCRRKN